MTALFDPHLEEARQKIERKLAALLPDSTVLDQAARYCALAGAKRIRPILTLAIAEAYGGSMEKALQPACAIELLHTYSLIHDDLPCMDDDDFRRGKPSVHKAFSEADAVLSGDYLLTYAFGLLATSPDSTAEEKSEMVRILSQAAGREGMVGGQLLDIQSDQRRYTLPELETLHSKKTGALIRAAIAIGALLGEAPVEDRPILSRYGHHIGLAFQIIDDILDVTHSLEKKGREASTDALNQKSTYTTLLGIEEAGKYAQMHTESAIEQLQSLSCDTRRLQKLTRSLLSREI